MSLCRLFVVGASFAAVVVVIVVVVLLVDVKGTCVLLAVTKLVSISVSSHNMGISFI